MEDSFKVLGRTTICMGTESTLGRMEGDTRVTMKWIRSMATVCTNGLMEEDTKEIG